MTGQPHVYNLTFTPALTGQHWWLEPMRPEPTLKRRRRSHKMRCYECEGAVRRDEALWGIALWVDAKRDPRRPFCSFACLKASLYRGDVEDFS